MINERKNYKAARAYHDPHGNRASTLFIAESRGLRNRRILASMLDDGSTVFCLKTLQKDKSITVTSIRLSVEAVREMADMAAFLKRYAETHQPKEA